MRIFEIGRAIAPAFALIIAGCGLDPLLSAPSCGDALRLRSGACCPPWTRAEDGTSCVSRSFSLPSASDGIGDPGASTIELAVDASGRGIAAWAIGGSNALRAAVAEEQAGGGWSVRSPAAALPGDANLLDVATEADGSATVVWRQFYESNGSVMMSRRDASGAWTDPTDLDQRISFGPTAYEPRITVASSGEVLLVWNQWLSTGYGVALARRAPGSSTWELPSSGEDVLSPRILYSNAPQITVGGGGDALITWYQSVGSYLMVRASERFGEDGEFSHPSVDDIISAPGAPVDSHPLWNPTPAVGPHGEAAIVWTQEDGKGAIPVYIATRDASGAWTRPKDLADTFSRPYGTARCARAAFDAQGELYITWYQNEGLGDHAYVARRAPSGEWVDGGRSPLLLSAKDWQGYFPTIAVGADGAVLVVWAESLGDAWRVGARRTSSGASWSSPEILSPEMEGVVTGLGVATGGPSARMLVGFTFGAFGKERAFFASAD